MLNTINKSRINWSAKTIILDPICFVKSEPIVLYFLLIVEMRRKSFYHTQFIATATHVLQSHVWKLCAI